MGSICPRTMTVTGLLIEFLVWRLVIYLVLPLSTTRFLNKPPIHFIDLFYRDLSVSSLMITSDMTLVISNGLLAKKCSTPNL